MTQTNEGAAPAKVAAPQAYTPSTTPSSSTIQSWTSVSSQNPCPICGKPDWCSLLSSGDVVACRRAEQYRHDGEPRTAKDGSLYWVFHRAGDGWAPGAPRRGETWAKPHEELEDKEQAEPGRFYSHERAAPEDLDIGYRAMLGALSLLDSHQEALRARGFSSEEVERLGYKSAPTMVDGDVKSAIQAMRQALTPGGGKIDRLLQIPGIWAEEMEFDRDEQGRKTDKTYRWHIGYESDGLLLPIRDISGRVVALQFRPDNPGEGAKYLPLCPPLKLEEGDKCGSPMAKVAHVPLGHSTTPQRVVLTEGVFKADMLALRGVPCLDAGFSTVGMSSAGAYRAGLDVAEVLGATTVTLAFDADARRKGHVAGAMVACALEAARRGFEVELLTWPEASGKGIDDVIAAGKADTIVWVKGRAVWELLAERLRQAGAKPNPRVKDHLLLADVVNRTTADRSYPFTDCVVRALADMEEGTRYEISLIGELERALGKRDWTKLSKRIRQARDTKTSTAIAQSEASNRPVVEITTKEQDVADAAIRALASGDKELFQRAYSLVCVQKEPERPTCGFLRRVPGTLRICGLAQASLRERLSACASWVSSAKNGHEPAHVPKWAVEAIHARGQWSGVRPLEGLVEVPVLRADGSILDSPGYDDQTGLLYIPNAAFLPVGDPTLDDVRNAVVELSAVVKDFPFQTPAHASAWMAAVLTCFARYAFAGPAPLIMSDGNVRGVGKSLLLDTVAHIATGRPAPRMAHISNEDEIEKRFTTIAMAGDPLVLIDNIVGAFGGKNWDLVLTTTVYMGRILGRSESVSLPMRVLWLASGNNVEVYGDTARRICYIRLASVHERPEEKTPESFAHPNLLDWVIEERPKLVRAALSILRGYVLAGKPIQPGVRWGSFEGWARLVASALVWAGLPDPCKTREALEDGPTSKTGQLSAFMGAWIQEFDAQPKTCAEVLKLIQDEDERLRRSGGDHDNQRLRDALLEFCPTKDGKLPTAGSLGKRLASARDRVVGGRRFAFTTDRLGTKAWRVDLLPAGDAEGAGDALATATREEDTTPEDTVDTPRRARACTPPASPASPASPDDDIYDILMDV